jgi:eukaryotic-like serine/threonine-protein kinase
MQERHIFIEAIQKGTAAERAEYLHSACGADPDLRRRVERLLVDHDRQNTCFVDTAATALLATAVRAASAFAEPGSTIGPYKLLEPIGEGGYGVVFMAEQKTPVQRRVALKIIKPGMDTKQVIARFEAERQALALMDHPNIAKVFDAGVTETGRPYFVMELVKGVPVTKYCDEQRLTPRQRVELFVQVCHAVQHAHQKGIIHRDIKPTNVLIALYDGKPVPKVIDFGVAKATGQRLTEATMFTGFGDVIGTPQYMSPEQAQLNQLDVDTRSDIYSLGVLLYELLTGTTPLEGKRVREVALLEVLRAVREDEPPPPSTRLTTSVELPAIAAQRRLEPKSLGAVVKGELDWIIMKALEKDRRRRYETVNGLTSDIQRYLRDEPVTAAAPSRAYRLRKYVRRNKATLTAVTLVALALALGTALSTWQAVRATRAERRALAERDEKEQARGVAAAGAARERQARDAEAAQRRQLEDSIDLITRTFERRIPASMLGNPEWFEQHMDAEYRRNDLSPNVKAFLLESEAGLAGTSAEERTVRLLKEARELRARSSGEDDPKTLRDTAVLAIVHLSRGEWPEALPLAEELFNRRRAKLGADHADTLEAAIILACAYRRAGRASESVELMARTFDVLSGQLDPQHVNAFWQLAELAITLRNRALFDDALAVDERLAGVAKSRLGLNNLATLLTMDRQGSDCLRLGRAAEAVTIAEEVVRRSRALQGSDHPQTRMFQLQWTKALRDQGDALQAQGRRDEATAAFRKAAEIDHDRVYVHRALAESLLDQGKVDEAVAVARKAIELRPDDAESFNFLAGMLVSLLPPEHRRPQEAVELAKKAVELSPHDGSPLSTLGVAQYRAGHWQEAVDALRGYMSRRGGGEPIDWLVFAMAQWQLGDRARAHEWYDKAVESTEKSRAELDRLRSEAAELLQVPNTQPATAPARQ